ncbi:MAG: 30S ribosome-binding factor RbfA [Candidatus Azambacteria bacterium]|nr:30S ribosome-binding factor RbfA [Candidatus Azambacteria bacterium]
MEKRTYTNHRVEKISELIKEEVGKIILKQVDIDKDILVTITHVKTSSDFAYATIYISMFNKEREEEILTMLQHSAGDIQFVLNRKLRMKPVPRIRFALDVTYEKEQRLYDILEHTKKEEHD